MYERPAGTLRENWFPPGTTFRVSVQYYFIICQVMIMYTGANLNAVSSP